MSEHVKYGAPCPDPWILNPCSFGEHRWAWLVDGQQACGYCGKARR